MRPDPGATGGARVVDRDERWESGGAALPFLEPVPLCVCLACGAFAFAFALRALATL